MRWVSSPTIPSRPDMHNKWYGGVHTFVSGNKYPFGSKIGDGDHPLPF